MAKRRCRAGTLMQRLSAELATAFVVVTHDVRFANTMNRVWQLTDGELNTVEVAVSLPLSIGLRYAGTKT